MTTVVGMMWNRNEGDILPYIIESALDKVDTLFIADDHSTDNSWDIIQSYAANHKDKIEYIRNERVHPKDAGQRQSLLDEIRRRYKPENTWVQVIESDIMILDTDVREAIRDWAIDDLGITWQLLNAARKPGDWNDADVYPNWERPIQEIMPHAHWIEYMMYTWRPLPGLQFDPDTWRPWPNGFAQYVKNPPLKRGRKGLTSPLLAHYGYRGPAHFKQKYGNKKFRKYPSWDLTSVETVEKTVYFFNGQWNGALHDMSRDGWKASRKG